MSHVGFLEKDHITGIKKLILSNGIKVFLEELPEYKKVIFLVGVGVGSRDDVPELAGISHFLEHIQFHSNRFRSADDINEDLEDGGTDFDAGTEFDSTIFYALGYPRYLSRSIRILYEAISNFEYNEDELAREKLVVLTELRKYLDSPEDYYLDSLFIPTLLRKTFSEKPILGALKTLKNIKKEDLISLKKKFYLPSNMIIFVCGRFEEEKILRLLEKTFGRLKPVSFEESERQIPAITNRHKEVFKKRKNLKLAYVAFGYRVPAFDHPDSLKLLLLESILSGGVSSRLCKKLRSERGIGYNDLGSLYDDYGNIGVFCIRVGGFDPRRFKEVKSIILKEIEDLKTNLVSKREFLRAKNLFLAAKDDELENLVKRAEMLSDSYFKKNIFDPRRYKECISKISRESLRRTAQKYFGQGYTLTALVPENFKK